MIYRAVTVEEYPEHIEPGILYCCDYGHGIWRVDMACPCGEPNCPRISLCIAGPALTNAHRPIWHLTFDEGAIPTLTPSINKLEYCKSHFFLTKGQVVWC